MLFRLLPLQVRAADRELLKDAGAATTEEQLAELLQDYWYRLRLSGGFMARHMKLRVSGGRLQRLFKWVMRPE